MKLFQIGVTAQKAHPVYIVNGVTVVEVGKNHVIDSNGKRWATRHTYAEYYKVGDSVIITHVHGTSENGPTLHNAETSMILNQREMP